MAIRWGIIGTGTIADTFATALSTMPDTTLGAVCSRTDERAAEFAQRFDIPQRYSDVEQMAQADIDVVYVATPHTDHAAASIRMLNAGKHVLCEKPMGLNHAQVMSMITAARGAGVFLMEAFMYRVHPQTLRVCELVNDGAIGDVRHIEAQFGYHAPFNADSRLFANALAGGGIMDVGCYPLSFARLLLGEPETVAARGHLGRTGVDEWSAALLGFANGATAQLATSVSLSLSNTATVYGSEGRLELSNPWVVLGDRSNWSIDLVRGTERESISGSNRDVYQLQAEHVASCLQADLVESPIVSLSDSEGNAVALDKWRAAIGLEYQQEQPATHYGALPRLARTEAAAALSRQNFAWTDKTVAPLVMGCDNQPSMSHAAAMWDHFVQCGGNCFDTAYIYGGGKMESLLGHWLKQRNNREDIVIIGKGAHSPHCFPEFIASELDQSLDRLQTDYVDLYFMHRDNLDVPVDEFVDALEAEVARGRIRAYGGSNWSLERLQAANDYANEVSAQGFRALSNNFSLAYMEAPVWPGVAAVNEPEFRDYLTRTGITLVPWSSQARGFFTPWGESIIAQSDGRQAPVSTMQPDAEELQRVWFSERNFARRARAQELAEQHGVDLIQVALAYVLHQPFPTLPIIGPRVHSETDSSIRGANLRLSAAEIKSLEL